MRKKTRVHSFRPLYTCCRNVQHLTHVAKHDNVDYSFQKFVKANVNVLQCQLIFKIFGMRTVLHMFTTFANVHFFAKITNVVDVYKHIAHLGKRANRIT